MLWTPRSVQSDWVRSEAHYAQDHNKLVPVTLEHCSLPLAFMLRQSVDLSSGVFDDSNPQWTKLLSWVEGELHVEPEPGTLPPGAAATAAVPLKAATSERWLGPTKRPSWAIGLVALAVALLAALFLLRADLGLAKPPQPDVVVDPFTAQAGAVPAGFAETVSNEMFSGFSTSSRITPVTGNGQRRANAYQIAGNVSTEGDKILVIAKLYAPGVEAPISTIKFAEPRPNAIAARKFGMALAEFTRCVTTASDSIGSKLFELPREAMGPWAKYCQQINSGTDETSAEAMTFTLREVVAAAPDFANGWSNLSELLWSSAYTPGANKAALEAEAAKAADRAIEIDPTTAKAYAIKARLALGLTGEPGSPSLLGRMRNFAEAEALSEKSISVRPSDCGCELPQYANLLTLFGRLSAARPLVQKAVGNDSTQVEHAVQLANSIASSGDPAGGVRMLDELGARWPDNQSVRRGRFSQALWRRDWPAARTALAALPDSPVKADYPALLDALQAGDTGRIRAAGAAFLPINANPQTVTNTSLWALALAGYDDEAVAAIEAAMPTKNMYIFPTVYRAPFVIARKTPRFAALAAKMGLIDYWKMPGKRPDFCNEPNPAALCATVSKS